MSEPISVNRVFSLCSGELIWLAKEFIDVVMFCFSINTCVFILLPLSIIITIYRSVCVGI